MFPVSFNAVALCTFKISAKLLSLHQRELFSNNQTLLLKCLKHLALQAFPLSLCLQDCAADFTDLKQSNSSCLSFCHSSADWSEQAFSMKALKSPNKNKAIHAQEDENCCSTLQYEKKTMWQLLHLSLRTCLK